METALGGATASHVREDRIDAVLVYATALGGWHCDVVLKGTPPGVPNTLGTPVGRPLATREEAERHGLHLLVTVLLIERRNRESKAAPESPVFLLCNAALRLRPEVFEAAKTAFPGLGGTTLSVGDARAWIAGVVGDLLPDVTWETFRARWEALADMDRGRILVAAHIANLGGVFVHPPRLDAAPDPEATQAARERAVIRDAVRERARRGGAFDA